MNRLFIFGAEYLYIIAVAIAFVYFLKQTRVRQKQIVILTVISLPLAYLVAKIIGLFYYDPRPFVAEHFKPLIPHTPDNGFPSDHSLLVSSIATLIYFFSKRTGVLLWILALMVGFSRIFVGVHHVIDIFGSIIISFVVVGLVCWVFLRRAVDKTG
jgi:undecaprenyl-diphosphatase